MNANASPLSTEPAQPTPVTTDPPLGSPSLRPVTVRKRTRGTFKFLWAERRYPIVAAITIPFLCWMGIGFATKHWFEWQTFDMVLTVSTLCVGLVIFWGEARENWELRLPRRLSVFFMYEGKTCMICHLAPLSHEGDVRNWGQQIGSQMIDPMDPVKGRLDFTPFIDLRRIGVVENPDEAFVHFRAVFHLKNLPKTLKKELEEEKARQVQDCCKVLSEDKQGSARITFEPYVLHKPRPDSSNGRQ